MLSVLILLLTLNCEDAVGIPRKNWKKLEDYQGRRHMEFGGNSGSTSK